MTPQGPPPKIAPTAIEGDTAATLRALRDRLAYELDETASARDVASLAARLSEVLTKLADLPTQKRSPADEIAKRRAARRATAAGGMAP